MLPKLLPVLLFCFWPFRKLHLSLSMNMYWKCCCCQKHRHFSTLKMTFKNYSCNPIDCYYQSITPTSRKNLLVTLISSIYLHSVQKNRHERDRHFRYFTKIWRLWNVFNPCILLVRFKDMVHCRKRKFIKLISEVHLSIGNSDNPSTFPTCTWSFRLQINVSHVWSIQKEKFRLLNLFLSQRFVFAPSLWSKCYLHCCVSCQFTQ